MDLIFVVASILSVTFTLLIAAGVFTYVRRTWQQIRSDSDGSTHQQLLDGVDQLQTQLYMVLERLEQIEGQLPGPEAHPDRRLSKGREEGAPEGGEPRGGDTPGARESDIQ